LITYTLDAKLIHLKVGLRAGDAKGLMKKIDALFKSYTLDALERATDAFRNTSMSSDNSSLSEYIANLTERAEVLKTMDKPVDPQAMAARFLKGLPSSYTNIADLLGINRKLTFDDACADYRVRPQQGTHR
jgi:AICAR transformylase/IMP cyclohydrolase PurH